MPFLISNVASQCSPPTPTTSSLPEENRKLCLISGVTLLSNTPTGSHPPDLPCSILSRAGSLSAPALITVQEIAEVLNTCKLGKSCGEDGVSYELLTVLVNSDLSQHLADLFNSILFGNVPIPDS